MSHLHLRQAAELLGRMLAGAAPAHQEMDAYFRAHREMGARDRALVADTVYGCLRQRRLLEHLAGGSGDLERLVASYLLAEGLDAHVLEQAGLEGEVHALAARVRGLDRAALPLAVRASLPDWLAERLVAQLGEAQAEALATALNRPAPLDLRVNTLKASRAEAQVRLEAEGCASEPTRYSPVGLRCRARAQLTATQAFQQGLFEVQDEGSQLLSMLLEPRRHETVVDLCAGAGGKTLHLGALMANTGTVYAFDVAARRLARLKPRLARAGLDTVRIVAIADEREARVRRLHGKIDRVLLDAPCSGTGRLRREPDLKWRVLDLPAFVAAQRRLLPAAAALVKAGGRLVYATCSLLREENDDVVAEFLAAHGEFRVVPANEILARRHIGLTMDDHALRLYPHRHGTDAFFAVALQRRS